MGAILRVRRLKRLLPAFKAKTIGIRLYPAPRSYLGIGDSIQFTSLPENFFRNTGQCLIDVDHHWVFNHNPYVIRLEKGILPDLSIDLWQDCDHLKCNYRKSFGSPRVYTSNAEANYSIIKNVLGGNGQIFLKRPRLYHCEDYPYEKRELILLHTTGRSNGEMPDYVIEHIVKKYGPTGNLVQIAGPKDKIVPGLRVIRPFNVMAGAELISKAKMFIGVDSGLAWVAACYPDVIVKKIRLTRPWGVVGSWDEWVPLEVGHPQSHWDDPTIFQLYNLEDEDHGIFSSWRKL